MRQAFPVAFLLALAACAHGGHTRHEGGNHDPAVRAVTTLDEYVVHGSTATAVRQALDRSGPQGKDGRYDAKTSWKVSWHYELLKIASGCHLGPVNADVEIIYRLPRWENGEEGTLSRRWREYMTALHLHEDGHADNGRAAGEAVVKALQALPARASCEEEELLARQTGEGVIHTFNALDDSYDARTNHGVAQGAVFP